jgi:hypothetical protein
MIGLTLALGRVNTASFQGLQAKKHTIQGVLERSSHRILCLKAGGKTGFLFVLCPLFGFSVSPSTETITITPSGTFSELRSLTPVLASGN